MTLPENGSQRGPTSASADFIGMAAMGIGNVLLIVNDTLVKLAARELPMSEVIFLRAAAAAALLFAATYFFADRQGQRPHLTRPLILRSFFELGTSFTYLYALQMLPIADLAGLQQVTPLVLLAGAAVAFRERIGWRGWLAALVGLGGALLILRPGAHDAAANMASVGAVLAILAVFFQVVRDLMTRGLPAGLSPAYVAGTSQLAMLAGALCLAPFDGWSLPTVLVGVEVLAAAAFLGLANFWLVTAMRSGRLSLVAPFRYAGLLAALVAGWWVWGEFPDGLSLLGSTVIVASGLYSLWCGRPAQARLASSTATSRMN